MTSRTPSSGTLLLGEPEIDDSLGEDPVDGFLERLGPGGPDGILADWDISLSVGQQTTTPDRFQATVVRQGEYLVVRGVERDTPGRPVLSGTDDTPLVIAAGDLDAQATRQRNHVLALAGAGVAAMSIV